MTDQTRADFLEALDLSDAVEVSEWEAQFIESNLGHTAFTVKQREVIDRMHRKYADAIGF